MSSSKTTNPVFERVLQKHIDLWKSDKRFEFSGPTPTPDDVLKEIESLEKEHEKTRARRYTARFATVVQGFQGYFSAVDAFVSSDPLIAGLVWGGIRFVIQTVCNFSSYFEEIVRVLELINRNLGFYHDYATELYKDSELVLKALADVYGDMLTVLMTVKRTFVNKENHSRNGLMITLKAMNPFKRSFDAIISNFNERRAILEDVAKHADRLRYAQDQEQRKQEEKRHEEAVRQRKQEEKRQEEAVRQQKQFNKFLKRLPYADCATKHADSRDVIQRHDKDKPGRWFLERHEFREWICGDTNASSGLLWAYAKPGAGKTILASTVIEKIKLQHSETAVAFFYCEHQDPDKHDPVKLLGTILHMIMGNLKPPLPPTIAALIDRHVSDKREALTLPVLSDLLCEVAKEVKKAFIVIDALDECEHRMGLLPTLENLANHIPLFITSRDEKDIRTSFAPYVSHKIPVRPSDIGDEIRWFIGEEIEDCLHKQSLQIRDRGLVKEIVEALAAGADGMYLWAILQINHLCEQRTDPDIRAALKDLPRGLEETFIRSLKKIDALAWPSKERLKKVLLWVACAATPLRLAELMELIAIDEMADTWDPERVVNDGQSLIDDCGHLLVTHESKGTGNGPVVQFIHASVHNFLTSNPELFGTTLPQYHIYPHAQGHANLARMCFRYLTTFSHGNKACIPFDYIVRSWIAHLWQSGEMRSQQFYKELFKTRISREPTDLWGTFPNATHVTAINCQFIAVQGTQYNVFLHSSDAGPSSGYVSPSFQKMFPNAIGITMKGCCIHEDFDGCHVMTHNSLGSGIANFSVNSDPLDATHITVNGLVFIGVSGIQYNMFLSESSMITCSRDDCNFFEGYRDNSIPGTNFFIQNNPQIYNSMELDSPFIHDKLLLDAYGKHINGTPQSFITEPFILSYSCLQRTRSCLQRRQDDEDPIIPVIWDQVMTGSSNQDYSLLELAQNSLRAAVL